MTTSGTTKIFSDTVREIRHFHVFCGLGGAAKGFNRGSARAGSLTARFRCIGGVDVDAAAIRDFGKAAGVAGTVADLFSRDQYRAFHKAEPPAGWREADAATVRRAAGGERPNIVFLSAPCKGFSGLLPETASRSDKYQALNGLTLRGVWLMLEAWSDDPPELIVFENVPRIANRGRYLLDQIVSLLKSYGYVVAETAHDCGALGGLAQSRKRFLLVARHAEKVPPFLYEPPKHRLLGVGDIIGAFPMPGPVTVLPMHRMPALQWKTWVRLAFVEAGADWRSLNRLRVENGALSDYGIVAETDWNGGVLGVTGWDDPSATVTGRGSPTTGRYSVADPRIDGHKKSVQLGVRSWDRPAGVVTGKMFAGGGPNSVADPRLGGTPFNHVFRVVRWDAPSPAVAGSGGPAGGAAVADPRAGLSANRAHYQTGGHYGVVPWDSPARAVPGKAKSDNGPWNIADPRVGEGQTDAQAELPGPTEQLVAMIRAIDGTWHRPFTTLELAALQGLVDPEETLELDGLSDSAWRERIGNAVPPPAAEAIAGVMGRTLLLAWSGETFLLSSEDIWVRDVATALSVAPQDEWWSWQAAGTGGFGS